MKFQVDISPISYSSIDGDGLLICVEGELDLATAGQLQGDADAAIADRRPVVLDLHRCPFIDSTGLRLVLHLHKGLTEGDPPEPLAVVAPPSIRKLFWMTAIDQSVPVFSNREQAMESVRASRTHLSSSYGTHPAVSAEG